MMYINDTLLEEAQDQGKFMWGYCQKTWDHARILYD